MSRFQPLDHLTEKRASIGLAFELLMSAPEKKVFARADDDERLELTIGRDPIERGGSARPHGLRQRVDRRMIDGHEPDATVDGEG